MKKTLFLALIFLSPFSFAGKGMVIVLETPFFKERSWDSLVVQNMRKGDVIFIHNKHMGLSTYEVDYGVGDRDLENIKDDKNEGFYQTLDRNGLPAFVPRKYIKLIYKDTREFESSVTPFEKDPTDYRLEEPLPKGYPLFPANKFRASLSMAFGPGTKNNYTYPRPVSSETFSSRKGIEFFYTSKVEFDPYDRFYFGGAFSFYAEEASFELNDGTDATEAKGQLGFGPFASYDIFRTKNNLFTLGGGININYNRFLVSQERGSFSEERIFSGFSFTPKLNIYYQRKNIVAENINLLVGTTMQVNFSHSLSSSTTPEIEDFWNDELASDNFVVPIGGQFTVFIGIQTSTE
jgi:hypothetical protein